MSIEVMVDSDVRFYFIPKFNIELIIIRPLKYHNGIKDLFGHLLKMRNVYNHEKNNNVN